ncbi:MAG TPA: threonine--tRNA ligase [Ktedonobacteraceae bacterium]|nr:threonine--tRNA ligase [Ktedonobacteraceae bacterium]
MHEEHHLQQPLVEIQEAQEEHKSDQRKLGRDLGLFMFSPDVGAGLPLWLPKGAVLRQTLERFEQQEQLKRGYLPVVTPHIGKIEMYKTSGHWYKYRNHMYPAMIENAVQAEQSSENWMQTHDSCGSPVYSVNAEPNDDDYVLKPMNCPHHIQIYKSELRSYRDLPLRLAEFGTVYRYEQSGELNGVLRTRSFTVDDSHIFVTQDEAEDEFVRVIELALFVFHALGLDNFKARIGLRDPANHKYIGSEEAWEQAQTVIMGAVNRLGIPYAVEKGEAGFYGPKLDFLFSDTLGRQWQLGTAQVDFNLPERFDLGYVAEGGPRARPVMIHRANFGSLERLIGVLLEYHGGNFPAWLAPVQVKIIPISEKHLGYAEHVAEQLHALDLRVEIDRHNERMNAKVRAAQVQKIPYMLVVGDKEMAEQTVSVRLRTNENLGDMPVASFIERVMGMIKSHSKEL